MENNNQSKMTGEARRQQLLTVGLKLAKKVGYMNVSRTMVGTEMNAAPSLVTAHFKTMDDYHNALVTHAFEIRNEPVIVQACAMRHQYARRKLRGSSATYWQRVIVEYLFK